MAELFAPRATVGVAPPHGARNIKSRAAAVVTDPPEPLHDPSVVTLAIRSLLGVPATHIAIADGVDVAMTLLDTLVLFVAEPLSTARLSRKVLWLTSVTPGSEVMAPPPSPPA